MNNNPLRKLAEFDQSIWLDYIRRDMLISGELESQIINDKVKGVTSNPAIFKEAFASDKYDFAIRTKALQGFDAKEIYQRLAIEDIQFSCDLFRPIYDQTERKDGYVSLEVSPELAHNTKATIEEARDLWQLVDRPNVLIKVPGTREGLPAIKQLISDGININVTLLFGLERYAEVAEAYLSGLEERVEAGKPIDRIASVASFFLSRIDVLIDPMLEKIMNGEGEKTSLAEQLHGEVAIASAKKAYQIYKELFRSDRFKKLSQNGAMTQRLLWASTGTKNPAYSNIKYVEALIGPQTVNTIPPETLEAYRDHGKPANRLEDDLTDADYIIEQLPNLGIDLAEITQRLEEEGVDKFSKPFNQLLKIIEERRKEALSLPVNKMEYELGEFERPIQDRLQLMAKLNFNKRIWEKDPTLWKNDEESRNSIPHALGWLDIAGKMASLVPRIQHFVREVQEASFTHVLCMGMGGSSLAPLLFERGFKTGKNGLQLTVLDTTSPATIQKIEQQLPLEKTLFIVASKSGTTAEPNAFGEYFYDKLKLIKGENTGSNFVAITDPNTPLADKARALNYRHIFTNFEDIGGRYSALTYFGLVPAALKGIDIESLLERAMRMQYACEMFESPSRNPALKLGAVMGELALRKRNKLTLVLSDSLITLGKWLEQLVAESTGKEGIGILPITGEELLDHSVYNEDRVFVHLYLKGEQDLETTKKINALSVRHPVVTIEIEEKLDIAQEFYRWEMTVAIASAIIGINAFNQPNVQESKLMTNQILKNYEDDGVLPTMESSAKDGDLTFYTYQHKFNSSEELLNTFMAGDYANDYLAIHLYLDETPEIDELLQTLRTSFQQRLKLATTVGYGPRFLHSTGQYHKGGPNTGLFIQLTAADEIEIGIPNKKYSFGVFKQAQADGDYKVLTDYGRRVIRVDLGINIQQGITKLIDLVSHSTKQKVH